MIFAANRLTGAKTGLSNCNQVTTANNKTTVIQKIKHTNKTKSNETKTWFGRRLRYLASKWIGAILQLAGSHGVTKAQQWLTIYYHITQFLPICFHVHPSPPLDNIWVMVTVWRSRDNIIRTALCWIVWHNVCSPQHTYVSNSYRSNRLGLSHWDTYAVRRGSCLELYYCNMVEWLWWDSSLILTTNWLRLYTTTTALCDWVAAVAAVPWPTCVLINPLTLLGWKTGLHVFWLIPV